MTGEAEVAWEILPFPAQVDLRLDPVLAERVPFELPLDPNTAREDGERSALWLGPDEWLIVGRPGSGGQIVAEIEASLARTHHSAVDVSANRAAIELSGPGVRALLSKGCSLDLHPRFWTADSCAQTMLGKAPVILHQRADTTRILVRPSFLDYLMEWLQAATRG